MDFFISGSFSRPGFRKQVLNQTCVTIITNAGSSTYFIGVYLAHVIETTKFTNSESPIFCLLVRSTEGRDTLQFIN